MLIKFDFPIHKPWFELTDKQKQLVWDGNKYFTGLTDFFKELEDKSYKIQTEYSWRAIAEKRVVTNATASVCAKRLTT